MRMLMSHGTAAWAGPALFDAEFQPWKSGSFLHGPDLLHVSWCLHISSFVHGD